MWKALWCLKREGSRGKPAASVYFHCMQSAAPSQTVSTSRNDVCGCRGGGWREGAGVGL